MSESISATVSASPLASIVIVGIKVGEKLTATGRVVAVESKVRVDVTGDDDGPRPIVRALVALERESAEYEALPASDKRRRDYVYAVSKPKTQVGTEITEQLRDSYSPTALLALLKGKIPADLLPPAPAPTEEKPTRKPARKGAAETAPAAV